MSFTLISYLALTLAAESRSRKVAQREFRNLDICFSISEVKLSVPLRLCASAVKFLDMKIMNLPQTIDAILISDAKTPELHALTQQAIASIGEGINVIVVESNRASSYDNVTIIRPTIPFNYNAYLNLGARAGNADYIFFGNNDIVFTPNWATTLIEAMNKEQIFSASPYCPASHTPLNIHPDTNLLGNTVYWRFCGWAFMWTRKLYNEVGGLDEGFNFWCSDNVTVHQLEQHNKEHMLVTSSVVHHIGKGHNTINQLDSPSTRRFTIDELEKFNRRFNADLQIDDTWRLPKNLKL